jgi:hypothetical protein
MKQWNFAMELWLTVLSETAAQPSSTTTTTMA